MYEILELVFWVSVFLVIYPYLIYPLILIVFNVLGSKDVKRRDYYPAVTVIIPAFNEADCIEATVRNKLNQQYPPEKINVIVVSDESEDGTDEIVKSIISEDDRLSLIRQEPRRGKAAGLNLAIRQAVGEVIVFSDANSIFDEQAIKNITQNFNDASVGYVTGNLNYTIQGNAVSEHGSRAYMMYENMIRKIETRFDSIIGSNGGVDAIRKELYKDIPQDQITDFVLPLHVIEQGKRVIYDERVQNYETPNEAMSSEFKMRVRVSLRAMRGIYYMKQLLNPFKNIKAAFCIVSHKVIRYAGAIFMLLALVSNALLVGYSDFYNVLIIMQLFLYVLAVMGLVFALPGFVQGLTKVPSYFLASNISFLVAMFKAAAGETMATWKPRQ